MKLFLIAAVVPALAFAELDRSLMSDAYWKIWNGVEQARIDADIEKNRKADGVFEVDAPDVPDVMVSFWENARGERIGFATNWRREPTDLKIIHVNGPTETRRLASLETIELTDFD